MTKSLASHAAAPQTSTLGICHTSSPPLCSLKNDNKNIVCSPPPRVSKLSQIYVNKITDFLLFHFVV